MVKKVKLFCVLAVVVIFLTMAVWVIVNRENLINKDNVNIVTEETVSLLIIEPDFFNPLVSKNKYVQEISNLVFDGLTKIDETLKPESALAKTFIPDETLTSWNVTLRDDITFHDGNKFTADDVIFTINKIKELGEKSYFAYNVGNIESISKVSDYEVVFKLIKADNFLMNKMDLPILSKNYY